MGNLTEMFHDFGFSEMIEVPAEGQAGGMVVIWNHEVVTVHNFIRGNQEIHATIEATEFNLLTGKSQNPQNNIPIKVRWHKPPRGCFKLNIDASFKNNNQKCGLGGVFRNSNGSWVVGFAKSTHANGSLEAEIKALLEGLRTAQEWGMFPLEIETDSTEVVNTPREGSSPPARIPSRE
ncbi:uncharacterized protein LOC142168804 [Nicotiana tabacum]|uniref:Uncharacterized protein LOC142168804 n=1 Tax=Nicotiana tabacum TaxID=4097 RepID=A0AC58SM59_TOBAC